MPTVALHTLGCKLNFTETSAVQKQLENEGYATVPFQEKADVYVINTCSVTENADKECKQIVRKTKRTNPDGKVVIIGCYAQLKPKEIIEIEGVDIVLGASEKFHIPQYLDKLENDQKFMHSCEIEDVNQFQSAFSLGNRTRAFLKVQDGCDYKCTYCTIPLARGISRSDSVENIVNQAQKIAEAGAKEIVLTGVNIGDYGKGEFGNKKHESTFLDLLLALDKVQGINRFRISSIEPNLLRNEIIDFVADSDKFVPHFHIPLQSGNNELLNKMKRRYLRELYQERVQRIKNRMPYCAIGVDVIVGFPGETEEKFLDTYQFINNLDVSYLHVFSYSERVNTEAAKMPNPVPIVERKKRSKMLRILSEKKRLEFYRTQMGNQAQVLWEEENRKGFMYGFTRNYVKCKIPFDKDLVNTISEVDLAMIDSDGKVKVQLLENTVNHNF